MSFQPSKYQQDIFNWVEHTNSMEVRYDLLTEKKDVNFLGLVVEAGRIFVLRPDLLPHPMAKKDWMKRQERNCEYIAYTRSLDSLFIVQ